MRRVMIDVRSNVIDCGWYRCSEETAFATQTVLTKCTYEQTNSKNNARKHSFSVCVIISYENNFGNFVFILIIKSVQTMDVIHIKNSKQFQNRHRISLKNINFSLLLLILLNLTIRVDCKLLFRAYNVKSINISWLFIVAYT